MKHIYIAETDENGHVACVWVANRKAKSVRVFDPERHIFTDDTVEFVGSSREKIGAWIDTQQH